MLELAEQSSSVPNLATKLLVEFFDEHELIGDVNVRGVAMNGSMPKRCLDSQRIDKIKKFCFDQAEDGCDKEALWRQCVTAMNKKISSLNLVNKNQSSFV
jgi:hypothetical protein